MTNDQLIKIIADMLQLHGDEDAALELEEAWARLKHELAELNAEVSG